MKFIKKILFVALFIQSTPSVRAMDLPQNPEFFELKDIMCCVIKHFGNETPFFDFWNFCSTNKKNYEKYKDNIDILKLIAHQSKYLNSGFPFSNQTDPASYKMLLSCVETDLPKLMGISRTIKIEYPFEINYETSLDMHDVFQKLVKIRTIEKKLIQKERLLIHYQYLTLKLEKYYGKRKDQLGII